MASGARFDATWLALREPADAAARDNQVVRALGDALATGGDLRVVDLASGTGANARYLLPRLPAPQAWLLADADADLLAAVPAAMARWAPAHACRLSATADGVEVAGATVAARLTCRQVDMALPDALNTLVDGRHLVTASALLDLVSAAWLDRLLRCCRDAGAAVHFALSYDGRVTCTPADPGDDMVRALVNAHQHIDKGFGPALGPQASAAARRGLEALGFTVHAAGSDWRLAPADAALQRLLVDGWASAAADMPGADHGAVDAWRARRHTHIDAGRSTIVVGHRDLSAWLSSRDAPLGNVDV